ncbi:MAG: putative ArsR family transcriptional regulator [Mariniblastus sp.]
MKQNRKSVSNPKKTTKPQSTQDAIEELDRVFHEKARLGILTSIIGAEDGMNFIDLKELCDLTDGNLNRHLKVLVDTGVLSVRKSGQGRNTNSLYRLTAKGRKAFERYLSALETILNAAKKSTGVVSPKTTDEGDGLAPAM